MSQGHIFLSISAFLVIYANTSKGTQNALTYPDLSQNVQIDVKLNQLNFHRDWHIWIILPPLALFFAKQIHFLTFMSKTLVLANQNIFQDKF
jgi:hypothetical protein